MSDIPDMEVFSTEALFRAVAKVRAMEIFGPDHYAIMASMDRPDADCEGRYQGAEEELELAELNASWVGSHDDNDKPLGEPEEGE